MLEKTPLWVNTSAGPFLGGSPIHLHFATLLFEVKAQMDAFPGKQRGFGHAESVCSSGRWEWGGLSHSSWWSFRAGARGA